MKTATSIMIACCLALPPRVAGAAGNGDEERGVLGDARHGVETLVRDGVHILTSPVRMDGRDALQLGAVLAVTGVVLAYDHEIHAAVQRNDDVFPLRQATELGNALDPLGYGRVNVFYFGGLAASYAADWDVGTALFGQVLTSFAVYGALKNPVNAVVGRRRPYEGEGDRAFGRTDATSFPSGHTISVFNLAVITSHHVNRPWYSWLAYTCAGSVAVQRVESNSHWPSDVLLSAAFAMAVSRGVIELHERREATVVPMVGAGGAGVALTWRF